MFTLTCPSPQNGRDFYTDATLKREITPTCYTFIFSEYLHITHHTDVNTSLVGHRTHNLYRPFSSASTDYLIRQHDCQPARSNSGVALLAIDTRCLCHSVLHQPVATPSYRALARDSRNMALFYRHCLSRLPTFPRRFRHSLRLSNRRFHPAGHILRHGKIYNQHTRPIPLHLSRHSGHKH